MDILITGVILGGTYALIALGLNLQYGVSRIMNLANGEMLVIGAFAAFTLFTVGQVSPLLTIFVVAPAAYVLNWLIYRIMLRPLVRRAKNRGMLEVDAILTTFGLSFVMVGAITSAIPIWRVRSQSLATTTGSTGWWPLAVPHSCVPRSFSGSTSRAPGWPFVPSPCRRKTLALWASTCPSCRPAPLRWAGR